MYALPLVDLPCLTQTPTKVRRGGGLACMAGTMGQRRGGGGVLGMVTRLLLSDPRGGGGGSLDLGQVSATHPPTQPPPPGGGGLCPPPAVTYKHLKICGTTEQN